MLILAILFFILGIALLLLVRRRQKISGLPAGRVIYTDTRGWGKVEQPLYDGELGLTGKPDYLVNKNGRIVPVEVKSSRIGDAPYDSHFFQLAAYCRLVEVTYGQRPAYGILHYPNRTFAIDYTAELENALINLLENIHRQQSQKNINRSHNSIQRCRACGYRTLCEQNLASRTVINT
jgi:CRISPR-associated exonuclease Cas4